VDTRCAETSCIMFGATLLMAFPSELAVLSGPGADNGEEPANAREISALESSRGSLKGRRIMSCDAAGWSGKKCLRSARFKPFGVEESARTGKPGGGHLIANGLPSRLSKGWLRPGR